MWWLHYHQFPCDVVVTPPQIFPAILRSPLLQFSCGVVVAPPTMSLRCGGHTTTTNFSCDVAVAPPRMHHQQFPCDVVVTPPLNFYCDAAVSPPQIFLLCCGGYPTEFFLRCGGRPTSNSLAVRWLQGGQGPWNRPSLPLRQGSGRPPGCGDNA